MVGQAQEFSAPLPRKGWFASLADSSSRKLVLWIALTYIVLSGLFLALALYLLRAEQIASSDRLLQAFARLTEEQTTRTFQSIDQTLLLARNIVTQADGADPAGDDAVHAALRALLADRPFLRSFWLLDADGRIVFNSSERYVGQDVSDREFFRYYRDHPDGDFAIHLPVRARATGQWYMTVTRAWRRPDGKLAGVIVATPERTYFEQVWGVDDIGDGTSVSLLHRDGIMLMRSPFLEGAMGRSFADSTIFRTLLPVFPAGTYLNASTVDGVVRLLAYRTLSVYPNLLIIVGRTIDQVLAPWRRFLWIALGSWGAGSVAASIILATLMTSLRASEQKLEAARVTNQRIFETSVDLILVVDRRGNLVQVSPSAMAILGYSPEEMVGRNAIAFIHPDDLEHTREEMRASRRGRVLRNFECRYRHKDGHVVALVWAGVWSEVAQQHFFIGRDMTERNAVEEQLRQAQKMEAVGQLTGGVAHDFNNLLTVILGNAEMLVESLGHMPELRQMAEMTSAAALRGAELTRSLLAFSRRQALEPKVIDVNVLVSEMDGLLRRTLGEHVEIEFKCCASPWRTMVDPAQLEAAVLNLAVNARDAMRDGGKLTIETANVELDQDYARQNEGAAPGFYVMVAVADTGTGMAPAVAARAFEPFFTTKEIGKGTGLGLSMVYGFTKQSNGHIKIYSELGHGTTIKLYLPRSESDMAAAGPAAAAEQRGGAESVLMVEDDDAVRAYVEGQLAGLGYRVLSARNGPEAIEVLRRGDPVDLLFTDVVMPGGMNGPKLAEAARRLRPDIKVLYTSGYTENAIVHQGRLDAGVELLSKPYRRQDLAAKLRKVLDGGPGPS